ncbi:hypothetical protein EVAR_4574_1 [Eumeta japonica]|uniref:Uncharacterized protein n=1 Tax=Eumeta variegata TaxID=151549 RepID=A0A4C1SW14_EUMVA|nr:hypothetical protein EVAR_4574_1 [Eumeta japonica]
MREKTLGSSITDYRTKYPVGSLSSQCSDEKIHSPIFSPPLLEHAPKPFRPQDGDASSWSRSGLVIIRHCDGKTRFSSKNGWRKTHGTSKVMWDHEMSARSCLLVSMSPFLETSGHLPLSLGVMDYESE